jgi:predicted small lipoprotein YifL
MKKMALSLVMVLVLLSIVTACGKKDPVVSNSPENSVAATASSTPTESAASTPVATATAATGDASLADLETQAKQKAQ